MELLRRMSRSRAEEQVGMVRILRLKERPGGWSSLERPWAEERLGC